MDYDETIRQMRKLFMQAEDYASLACDHLWLEITYERASPINESAVTDLDADELLHLEMLRELHECPVITQTNSVGSGRNHRRFCGLIP